MVDSTSFLYRAWHAKKTLEGFDDEVHTPLILMGNDFARLVSRNRPAFLSAAFDGPRNSVWRRQVYPAYKANRDEQPAELLALLPKAKNYLRALGCRGVFQSETHEGDDLMSTLREFARREAPAMTTVLVTEDKDMLQLVDSHTLVLHPRSLEVFDVARVEAKMGVPPSQLCDMMALAGDQVDGIPGVKGCGPQTAVRLMKAFGSLENMYANIDDVPSVPNLRGAEKLHEKLVKQKEDVFLFRSIISLVPDVECGLSALTMDDMRYEGVDLHRGEDLLAEAMGEKGVGLGPYLKLQREQRRQYVPF